MAKKKVKKDTQPVIPMVVIYTDGAFNRKYNSGGWGSYLLHQNNDLFLTDYVVDTTNNRMEIQAVISALEKLNTRCQVIIYSDSQYVVNSINNWIYGWAKNNWKSFSKGGQIANIDMWQKIYQFMKTHKIKAEWVKGHANNPGNNLCDELAMTSQFIHGGYRRTS